MIESIVNMHHPDNTCAMDYTKYMQLKTSVVSALSTVHSPAALSTAYANVCELMILQQYVLDLTEEYQNCLKPETINRIHHLINAVTESSKDLYVDNYSHDGNPLHGYKHAFHGVKSALQEHAVQRTFSIMRSSICKMVSANSTTFLRSQNEFITNLEN